MFVLGINIWSYPKSLSIDYVLKHAAQTGYRGVEVAIYQEDVDALGSPQFDEKWRHVAEVAASLGLEIPSVATGLFWRYNIVEDQGLEKALKVVEAECRAASILGAKLILVIPGVGVPSTGYVEHIERASRTLKRMAAIARNYGVKIGLENVWNRILASPLDMAKLIDEVGEDNVGAYFDAGNTLPHSLPEHWIRILGKRIFQVHVKDFSIAELRFGIPLTGDVNWVEVRKALEEIGYSGYIVAEVPPYHGDPYKAAEDTFTSLKRVFG